MAGKVTITLNAANAVRLQHFFSDCKEQLEGEDTYRLSEAIDEFTCALCMDITDSQISESVKEIKIQSALGYDLYSG